MKRRIKRKKKRFDAVKIFQKIKTQIGKEIHKMNDEEFKAYLAATPRVFQRGPNDQHTNE